MIGIALVMIVGFVLTLTADVHANPSQLVRNNPSIATSTLTYMTAGNATTTNTFNTQSDGGAMADTAAFTVCLTASTTSTVLNTSFEYSYDGMTYFQDNVASSTGGVASTNVFTSRSYTWTFASTSMGGVPPINSFGCKVVAIPTPLPYVRAIMSLTGAAGGVWSDFAAKREQR